jgi:ribosomal protein S18 acetylase RimI-like enzyme
MTTSNGAIEVILAGVADISRLAPLFDAYRRFYEQPSDLPAAEAYLIDRLARSQSVIFLAQAQPGPAVGFTQLYPSFSSISMRPLWILNDLFVVPEYRRLGVGRALLQQARAYAVGEGASGMVLETALSNKSAQALYESLGWKRDELFYTYELDLRGAS